MDEVVRTAVDGIQDRRHTVQMSALMRDCRSTPLGSPNGPGMAAESSYIKPNPRSRLLGDNVEAPMAQKEEMSARQSLKCTNAVLHGFCLE